MRIGAVEPVHEKRHPGRASLEKADAQLGKAVEDAVGQHGGGLGHDAERMAERVNRVVNADGVHAEMMQCADVDGERHVELFRFFVDRPIDLRAIVAFDAFTVGRQHGTDHAELFHRAAQLGDRRFGVLDRDQRHSLDAGRDLGEFLVEPIIVRAACGDGPVFGDDSAHGQARSRVNRGPSDLGLIEEVDPFPRPDVAGARALVAAFQIMKMDMIEGRKYLSAISRRHVLRDFVHARPIVHMPVGVDDLHCLFPFASSLRRYNKQALLLSTMVGFRVSGLGSRVDRKNLPMLVA